MIRQRCQSTLAKTHLDACEDGLADALVMRTRWSIAGCEAHVCLLQTALGLLRAGRCVWVVGPACGSRSSPTSNWRWIVCAGRARLLLVPRWWRLSGCTIASTRRLNRCCRCSRTGSAERPHFSSIEDPTRRRRRERRSSARLSTPNRSQPASKAKFKRVGAVFGRATVPLARKEGA